MPDYSRPLLLLLMTAITLRAAEPVPVRDEPRHKVVFENDYVRVLDVQIPPGAITLYHVHVLPSVVVYLTKSTNRSETWGESGVLNRDVSPGESRYAPYDVKPLTHRVTNTGAGLFRVFDIELLRPKTAAAASFGATPGHAEPQWEEKIARSARLRLARGDTAEIPADACAHLFVAVSGKMKTVSGPDSDSPARRLNPGDYQFFPARTRLAISPGDAAAEGVLLDLK